MAEPSHIQDIVIYSAKKEPSKVGEAFDAAMNDKLKDLLDQTRIEVARSLFLAPGEVPAVEVDEPAEEGTVDEN